MHLRYAKNFDLALRESADAEERCGCNTDVRERSVASLPSREANLMMGTPKLGSNEGRDLLAHLVAGARAQAVTFHSPPCCSLRLLHPDRTMLARTKKIGSSLADGRANPRFHAANARHAPVPIEPSLDAVGNHAAAVR